VLGRFARELDRGGSLENESRRHSGNRTTRVGRRQRNRE
jgi:hypothetical protein